MLEMKECVPEDLPELRKISYDTYKETFGHMNTESDMKEYLDRAFNEKKLRAELADPDSCFYFFYTDGELSGYIKLNESGAQTDINDDGSLELERIYVKKEHQGKGFGNFEIRKAEEIAKSRGKKSLWLGVWEKNEKAIVFYKKHGYSVSGTHAFVMGDDVQTDFVMRKDL